MNYKNCLTAILLLSMKVWGQEIKGLSIGERVPSINVRNIHNYLVSQLQLSSLNDKTVILHFISINCAATLKDVPRLDSMQKGLDKKIQIFLISKDNKDVVQKFLRSNYLQLPIIGEDSILSNYFPHSFLPHDVLINKGMVTAITFPEYVNEKNIVDGWANLPIKLDQPAFNYNTPLLHADSEKFYSLLTAYIPNVPPKYVHGVDSSKKLLRSAMFNMGLIDLYQHCLSTKMPIGKILIKGNRNRFLYDGTGYHEDWKRNNVYCFEAVLPITSKRQHNVQIMKALSLYTRVEGSLQTVAASGYTLSSESSVKLVSKEASRSLRNIGKSISVKELMFQLNNSWYGIPFVNKTGYENHYINIPDSHLSNLPLLKQSLKEYGLNLTPSSITTEMLVLEEKQN